jgi:hypothetical protein
LTPRGLPRSLYALAELVEVKGAVCDSRSSRDGTGGAGAGYNHPTGTNISVDDAESFIQGSPTATTPATLIMTDKLSSPSSSSAGVGSGYSPHGSSRATTNSGSDEPSLVITQQPPFSVYSNESFEVEIHLELPKTSSPPSTIWSNEPLELAASLHYAKTGRTCANEAILMTEPMRITMDPSIGTGETKRVCQVRCIIRMDSIRRDTGASLEVRFAPRQGSSPTMRAITGTATRPINIVDYKIRVTMDDDWEPIWYKDEGGRDKSMEVFVAIYDKEGQIKTGEQIPLQPILCYKVDDGPPIKVANQDVLRTLGSTKIYIDKDTGRARIRFRVEDVSKNHQGQDFVLQVGPDSSSKGFKDVAPAYTPAVNVRSKRNKRSRNPNLPRLKDPSEGGRSTSPPAVSRPRLTYGGDQDSSPSQRDTSFQGQDIGRLREAMKGVISWADEVVNGLYPLQWQIVGYGQHSDGTPDYTRPYHNMPNPNGPINRILSMYSDQVRDNLRILLNAVEQSGSSARSDEYMPFSLPREPADPYGIMGGSAAGSMHVPAARGSMHPPLASESARQGMHMGVSDMARHGHHPSMSAVEAGRPGVHPSVTSEAFRGRPDAASMAYSTRAHMPSMQGMQMVPPHYSFHGAPPPNMDDYSMMPSQAMRHHEIPSQRSRSADEESRENEVEYVLAKQYKALRTGERLGFPAYSANKEILGFYREASSKVGVGQFVPISRHRNDFGPLEILQATEILEDCIAKKSDAVHALKDWGSIANLLDHALVYDWSKDIRGGGEAPSTAPV